MNILKLNKLSALLILGILLITSCDPDNDPSNNFCDTDYVSTPITNIFSVANGYDDLAEYMDLETHEYRIKIYADGEICSVGYQNPSNFTGSYHFKIINETTNQQTAVNHSFSQANLEYKYISTLVVNAGDIIKVSRTIFGHTSLNQTVGRILRPADFSAVPYPIAIGNVEFLSSNFYGAGGPVPNLGQPYIPLGFIVN